MTGLAASIHVVDVQALADVYRGDGPWAAFWASWQTCWPWPGQGSSSRRCGAGVVAMAGRRNRKQVVTGRGRTSRSRRTAEKRRHKSARERGWDGRSPRGLAAGQGAWTDTGNS